MKHIKLFEEHKSYNRTEALSVIMDEIGNKEATLAGITAGLLNYINRIGHKFSSFDDYQDELMYLTGKYIFKTKKDVWRDIVNLEDMDKGYPGMKKEVGAEHGSEYGAPGFGTLVVRIKKIENGKAYIETVKDTLKELSPDDVI